jgi:hypothetical protein
LSLTFSTWPGFINDRQVRNNTLSGTYENLYHYVGFDIGKKF